MSAQHGSTLACRRSTRCAWTLVAIVLALLPCASVARAQWDDGAAWFARQVLAMRRASLPQQPKFADPIAADSQNAAARYLWLAEQLDGHLARATAELQNDLNQLRVDAEGSEVTVEEICAQLDANQTWIHAWMEATRLERFELYASDDPTAAPYRESDPRRSLLGDVNRARRVLRADAIRLWVKGDRAAAVERATSIVRMGAHLTPKQADLTGALIADATIAHGERLLEQMQSAAKAQGLDESVLAGAKSALLRVDRTDPGGVRKSWFEYRKRMLAYAREQLDESNAGIDLSFRLAELKATQVIMDRMLEPLREVIQTGQRPAVPFDPVASLRSPKTKERLVEASRELAGVTVEELVGLTDEAEELGARLQAHWDDPKADELFATVDKRIDADKAAMLTLLLATPKQIHKQWKEGVDRHARALQLFDVAPVVSPPR